MGWACLRRWRRRALRSRNAWARVAGEGDAKAGRVAGEEAMRRVPRAPDGRGPAGASSTGRVAVTRTPAPRTCGCAAAGEGGL